jgi:hypothetical protein
MTMVLSCFCIYGIVLKCSNPLPMGDSVHRHSHGISKYPDEGLSPVSRRLPMRMRIGGVYKLSLVGQPFWQCGNAVLSLDNDLIKRCNSMLKISELMVPRVKIRSKCYN